MDKKTRSKIKYFVVHCSDSSFGNAALIDSWHRARGWDSIGYHKVILNGRIKNSRLYRTGLDGLIETGRDDSIQGAHCKEVNAISIGVCLIGKAGKFTDNQYNSLARLFKEYKEYYPKIELKFHSDFSENKPNCPGIDERKLIGYYASCSWL